MPNSTNKKQVFHKTYSYYLSGGKYYIYLVEPSKPRIVGVTDNQNRAKFYVDWLNGKTIREDSVRLAYLDHYAQDDHEVLGAVNEYKQSLLDRWGIAPATLKHYFAGYTPANGNIDIEYHRQVIQRLRQEVEENTQRIIKELGIGESTLRAYRKMYRDLLEMKNQPYLIEDITLSTRIEGGYVIYSVRQGDSFSDLLSLTEAVSLIQKLSDVHYATIKKD